MLRIFVNREYLVTCLDRMSRRLILAPLLCLLSLGNQANARSYTAEELAQKTKNSVVTLSHKDRNGDHNGMGTGFVIDENGLIATSLHVIGEARPVNVRFPSGKSYAVESIHAWDRKLDLAVIKIDASGLTPLTLGDSEQLRNGQPVVALGNPMGLEQSIVTGVVSGIREFEHTDMIQLAIPIEPGNSGGPLLDLEGHVHGLLNLKSTVTENLGFATPVSKLKALLAKPNSVPIQRWLRIGALNPDLWQVIMGGQWSQVTGRIKVSGAGSGFGGRALCLRTEKQIELPYEIEVSVKLKDESGAAGLVFCSDGGNCHYGFYPSNGQIRLTRFDGENVFSWNILHQIPSSHYLRNDWNKLRIRHTETSIEGFLNDHLILTSRDKGLGTSRVGLAKFRTTEAEFKGFKLTRSPDFSQPGESEKQEPFDFDSVVGKTIELTNAELLETLREHPQAGQAWLIEEAQQLESEARRLRETGTRLHRLSIAEQLTSELEKPEATINLLKASLLIAKHDKPQLPIKDYLAQARFMANEIKEGLQENDTEAARVARLTNYLFKENGFHGSYFDYSNSANSYLDNVIDDREGLPITLSILFLELGRLLDVEGLSGFPLPFHFLVKHQENNSADSYQLIDVFNAGERMTYADADKLVSRYQATPFRSELLESSSKREIINRMLRNLIGFTQEKNSLAESLPYLDLLIALNPEAANFYLERAWIHLRAGNSIGARTDLQWILDHKPEGINLQRVREALESL